MPILSFELFLSLNSTIMGGEKTYTYKSVDLRLNAKIAIGSSISGRISLFHGRFQGKAIRREPHDENTKRGLSEVRRRDDRLLWREKRPGREDKSI
jgi:hypothetical protein